eukprot:284817287_6
MDEATNLLWWLPKGDSLSIFACDLDLTVLYGSCSDGLIQNLSPYPIKYIGCITLLVSFLVLVMHRTSAKVTLGETSIRTKVLHLLITAFRVLHVCYQACMNTCQFLTSYIIPLVQCLCTLPYWMSVLGLGESHWKGAKRVDSKPTPSSANQKSFCQPGRVLRHASFFVISGRMFIPALIPPATGIPRGRPLCQRLPTRNRVILRLLPLQLSLVQPGAFQHFWKKDTEGCRSGGQLWHLSLSLRVTSQLVPTRLLALPQAETVRHLLLGHLGQRADQVQKLPQWNTAKRFGVQIYCTRNISAFCLAVSAVRRFFVSCSCAVCQLISGICSMVQTNPWYCQVRPGDNRPRAAPVPRVYAHVLTGEKEIVELWHCIKLGLTLYIQSSAFLGVLFGSLLLRFATFFVASFAMLHCLCMFRRRCRLPAWHMSNGRAFRWEWARRWTACSSLWRQNCPWSRLCVLFSRFDDCHVSSLSRRIGGDQKGRGGASPRSGLLAEAGRFRHLGLPG